MRLKKLLCMVMAASIMLSGCNKGSGEFSDSSDSAATEKSDGTLSRIDMTKWQYNSENDVYWQVGISYCASPDDTNYETMGLFVPGGYFDAVDNRDGTYTCTINKEKEVGKYTADMAPMVIPVDTPGYSAMNAPTDYDSRTAAYTSAGFIYVYAGCRGRDAGAPAGVTDLKAAVRYVRYCKELLPGDTDRIFSFGMSGGGAQSAVLGSTGDSEMYTAYLDAIGAVSGVSDAVAGSMCWCPITNLDTADAAYEWNLGVTRTDLSEEEQKISDGLAAAYAEYINSLGLTSADGTVLALEESKEGIYQSGTYYEYVKKTIEDSLNHFLSDTTFPYTASTAQSGKMGGGQRGKIGDGDIPDGFRDGDIPEDVKNDRKGEFKDGNMNKGDDIPGDMPNRENEIYDQDGIGRNITDSSGMSLDGTYDTAKDYIAALNADTTWVKYDSKTNTATITSAADFAKALKNASKGIGAFDQLDGGQGENTLFGYGDGKGAHFDAVLAKFVEDSDYSEAFKDDLSKKDAQGNTVDYRVNMYTPMYFLSKNMDGYKSSTVAKYWRIRTGINQSDTALSTEINLALALENYGMSVDFATVWGQGHVEAECTGDADSNFIEWVNECMTK